jgi:hypothetical protein
MELPSVPLEVLIFSAMAEMISRGKRAKRMLKYGEITGLPNKRNRYNADERHRLITAGRRSDAAVETSQH